MAIVAIVAAAGLIAYQVGMFHSEPPPLAASPEAQADDDQNPDDPGKPPPKSTFSRKAQPARP